MCLFQNIEFVVIKPSVVGKIGDGAVFKARLVISIPTDGEKLQIQGVMLEKTYP